MTGPIRQCRVRSGRYGRSRVASATKRVILAALATLIFGTAFGLEMPLILIGGGLGALTARLGRRDIPDRSPQAGRLRWKLRGYQHAAGIAPG